MTHSFLLTMPALTGDVVTERHTAVCRTRGHATHTVNGVDSGACPRCGATKRPVSLVKAYVTGSVYRVR
jgi:hypothetical protein